MLKHSHLVTPRTLAECQFQTGYRPAIQRDMWAEAGHLIVGVVGAVGALAMAVLLIVGAL